MLLKAKAAGMESLEFRRKMEREMRFKLVLHDSDALFNIIDQQRQDQAVIEANDAARRQKQRGMTLHRCLLRAPSYRAMLLTNPTEARAPRPLG